MSRKAALAAFVVASSLGGCGQPAVSIEVSVPASVQGVAWIEVAAFRSSCPTTETLAGGLPIAGMTSRVAFAPGSAAPAIGSLAAGPYGFAAVARGADCTVLATGCSVVDVTRARDVRVATAAVPKSAATACGAGAVCSDARCVPVPGVDDPSYGAGCTMQLVGAGPFPNGVGADAVQASMPAIAAIGDGFVIAYAELSQQDGTTRFSLVPIDHDGALLAVATQELDGRCAGAYGGDAAALAPGLTALARPPCPTKSGLDLFAVSTTGAFGARHPVLSAAAPGPSVLLSPRSLAQVSASSWVLAERIDGTSTLALTDGVTVSSTKAFGTPQDTAARVARSSGVQIVEADGPGVAQGDAGVSGNQVRVYLSPASGSALALPGAPTDQLAASRGAVAAVGTRAFAVTDGGGKGFDLVGRIYDLGSKDPPLELDFALSSGTGSVVSMDAIALGDRLFVAASRAHAPSIEVADRVTTATPIFLREVSLADDLRVPQAYVDGSISIAATSSRVALAWTNRKGVMPFGDPVGGYAVFACR